MRAVMAFCSEEWRNFSPAAQALWEPLAAQADVPPFNAYLTFNLTNARNGLAPSQMPDPTRDGSLGSVSVIDATAVSRGIRFDLTTTVSGLAWGYAIYNLPNAAHPKSWDHLIHYLNFELVQINTWTWRPIPPATYYLALAAANKKGRLWDSQVDKTVTVT